MRPRLSRARKAVDAGFRGATAGNQLRPNVCRRGIGASRLAAAAAWDSLAADLQSASSSYGSTVGSLVAGAWTGPSSTAMAAAASPFVAWVSGAAAPGRGRPLRRPSWPPACLRSRFRGHGAPAHHRGQSRAVGGVGRD